MVACVLTTYGVYMRIVAVFVSLLALSPSKADDAAQLMGAWKLVSFTSQIVGENEPAKDVWGQTRKASY